MAPGGRDVRISVAAEGDLQGIYRRRLDQRGPDGLDGAEALLSKLIEGMDGLRDFAERGPIPVELAALGIRAYRQITLDTYRVIYRVDADVVTILIVADARQDFRRLLEERLLRVPQRGLP